MKSSKQKKFIKLYSAGFTLRHIAKLLNVSSKTLIGWKKAFNPCFNANNSEEFTKIKEDLLASRADRALFLLLHFRKIREAINDESVRITSYFPLLPISLKILHELEKYEAFYTRDDDLYDDDSEDEYVNENDVEIINENCGK